MSEKELWITALNHKSFLVLARVGNKVFVRENQPLRPCPYR